MITRHAFLSLFFICICMFDANAQISTTTLASGLSISSGIVMDSTYIYWAEDDNTVPYSQDATTGLIRKVSKNGGTVTTLVSGLNHPVGVLLDNANVCFIERGSYPNNNGSVKKVPKSGGTVTTLASGLDYPQGACAIDAINIYFQEPCDVSKVGINGGTVTTVASDVCWGPYPIAVDNHGNLFYAEVSGLTSTYGLKKVSVSGGTITTLATVSTGSVSIALGNSIVYWTEQGTPAYSSPVAGLGVLREIPKNGGTSATLASSLNAPSNVVLDSTTDSLFWVEAGTWSNNVYVANTGSIKKMSVGGGTVTTLTSELNAPSTILIDADYIYWSENPSSGACSIKKMPREGGQPTSAFLNFPLKGFTPYDAPIVSVFDHSGRRYSPNDTVEDFAGEVATVLDPNEAPALGKLYSYKKPDGTAFLQDIANYVGTLGTGPTTLNYDGHPGYDYRVPIGTTVYAAASGTVIVAHNLDDGDSGKWVRILHSNSYLTQYLHLNDVDVSVGQNVNAGDSIGHSGNTGGVAAHLHFEVKKVIGTDSISVDPYGWNGNGVDPYAAVSGITNENLWLNATPVRQPANVIPSEFALLQNYPNPFNPSTTISYQLPTKSLVVLKVFDVLGREIETLVNEPQNAGNHFVKLGAANLPSGVYFYTLQAGTYHDTKKLLLLK